METKNKVKETSKRAFNYFFKKKLITTIIVSVFAIGIGVTAGIVIDKFFIGQTATNYDDLNQDDYTMDVNKLLIKYEALGHLDDYTTKLKSYEMINIGFGLYSRHTNALAVTHGSVTAAGQEQTIRDANIKVGDNYLDEQISCSGIVQVAVRSYQDQEGVTVLRGNNISKEKASWPNQGERYTLEDFTNVFGRVPAQPSIFLISKKTVKSANITRDGKDYIIETQLTKKSSVLNYVKQMKAISDLKDLPTFNEVRVTFKFDENLLIKEMHTHEDYFARTSSGIGSTVVGGQDVIYYVDGDYKIPSENENFNYNYEEGGATIC
ncbi:MAG: hypothetical protein MJ213_04880 [Bacilli bacterium]|nr:hypothetical protein [Bacilli bacterium]